MSVEIIVPAAGDSITSATIGQWHVQEGQHVALGDLLVSLETDKVSQELSAEVVGKIHLLVAEGEEVQIGQAIAQIEENVSQTPEIKVDEPIVEEVKEVIFHEMEKPKTSRKKLSPLRKKIATQLVQAQHQSAILTTFNECDMSQIIHLRKELQKDFVEKYDVKLGFMSFFIKAVVQALVEVPQINARLDGDEIVQNHYYDIGVAVGTSRGLVVPVVRNADLKSFAEIERDILQYGTKAREGKLEIADLQDGVFTITNGGIYGSLMSTPIINPPQSGILGMHAIKERPVAVDGNVEIRPMMYLALSYDHRLVDGKEAVTFLVKIKELLENPVRMLLGI